MYAKVVCKFQQMGIVDQKRLRRHRLRKQAGYDPGVPVATGAASVGAGGSYATAPSGSGASDATHYGSTPAGSGLGSLLQRPSVVSSRQSSPEECCCCGVGEVGDPGQPGEPGEPGTSFKAHASALETRCLFRPRRKPWYRR